ncbi:MAG TPA: DUF4389 domain-containing protein [Spirochaetia bacterium]|nr:DUF4389 domain-containing protein [Spirochaetia bacterium]
MANAPESPYPVSLEIDYPERLNRLTSAFRIILILPVLGILLLVSAPGWGGSHHHHVGAPLLVGGIVFIPTVLMILFRWKYPKWWFDWNVGLMKFATRVRAYLWLLTDKYPSTDEEQAVHIDIRYPDVQKDLKAGLPLVKWFLAIPHYVCIIGLAIGVVVVVIIAWFAILFTGKYPRGLFNYVVGVMRWSLRVIAYAFLLTTDIYPPFSLE